MRRRSPPLSTTLSKLRSHDKHLFITLPPLYILPLWPLTSRKPMFQNGTGLLLCFSPGPEPTSIASEGTNKTEWQEKVNLQYSCAKILKSPPPFFISSMVTATAFAVRLLLRTINLKVSIGTPNMPFMGAVHAVHSYLLARKCSFNYNIYCPPSLNAMKSGEDVILSLCIIPSQIVIIWVYLLYTVYTVVIQCSSFKGRTSRIGVSRVDSDHSYLC